MRSSKVIFLYMLQLNEGFLNYLKDNTLRAPMVLPLASGLKVMGSIPVEFLT